ncbi:MAG: MATE family efflux transporter, partial [Oscillospiraceae bacterium]
MTFHLLNSKKILKGFTTFGEIPESREIVKTTLHMAWPSVLESFLVSLTGFVDTIMVSVLGSAAIAAVGLTTQPKFLGLCIFFALGTAISSIVARRMGEGDRESANKVLRMALILAVIFTAIISVTFILGADFIIDLAGSSPDTHEDAVAYFVILMIGLIFTSVTLVINAAQRGAGNTKIAMRTNVTSNLVNVVFNYLLIGGNLGFPALGVRGAAIATVIGTIVGCVMSIVSIVHPSSFIYFKAAKGFFAPRRDIRSMLNVGSSAFIEQLFMRIGFFLFLMTVANLGTTQLAAHQIGMNFMSISFSFADGLAVASVALVGRSLGEGRRDMARLYSSACQRLGIICAVVVSVLFFFFGRGMFSLFSNDVVILDYGDMIMKVLCVVIYLQIEQVVILGCLRGAGDTKYTAFISLISVAIIRPGASWLLCYPLGLGLTGVWLGLCADQLVRFAMG